jgi:hypothetical protein
VCERERERERERKKQFVLMNEKLFCKCQNIETFYRFSNYGNKSAMTLCIAASNKKTLSISIKNASL